MQQVIFSDLLLVVFSVLLGGLIGMFWERARHERRDKPSDDDVTRRQGLN
jgi:hypothetical protein